MHELLLMIFDWRKPNGNASSNDYAFFVVVALLAMLFVALVAAAAAVDRARVSAAARCADRYSKR